MIRSQRSSVLTYLKASYRTVPCGVTCESILSSIPQLTPHSPPLYCTVLSYDQVRGTDSSRTPVGSMGHAVVRGSALKGHTGDKGSSSGRNHYGQSSPDEYHHGQQYGGRIGDLQLPSRDSPRQPVTSTSSIPIAITNTNRATLSQVKARKRLQQSSQKTPTDVAPRRILNYARGNDDDDVR